MYGRCQSSYDQVLRSPIRVRRIDAFQGGLYADVLRVDGSFVAGRRTWSMEIHAHSLEQVELAKRWAAIGQRA